MSVIIAYFLAIVLWIVTVPIARSVARSERDPRLEKLLMYGVTLHLLYAPLSTWVIDHYYGGITDYHKYIGQGVILAKNFDSFQFTLAGTHLQTVGASGVSVAIGIVFALIGQNNLAGMFIFGWFAFLGSVWFFKAYALTFPEGDHRRYARMIFYLPSILFWTAGISKESMMYVSLGLASYGIARILVRRPGGVIYMLLGAAIGIYVRPQELLVLAAAAGIATLFGQSTKKSFGGVRRIAMVLVQAGLLFVALNLTKKISGVFALKNVAQLNGQVASSVSYSSSPATYPIDVYHVMFDPLLYNAHGAGQRVASVENLILLTLIILSARRLRHLLRAAFMRPYVMTCILYTGVWMYSFAALGNLGIIERERVLMLPFLLVLLCIPVAPKGKPPQYPWEQARRVRRRQRRTSWSGHRPATT